MILSFFPDFIFESNLYHRPQFEAVSLFQKKYLEIASCAVSLLNDIWVRFEHSLLQKLKSIAVQAVYRQDKIHKVVFEVLP